MDVLNVLATVAVMLLHGSEFAFNYSPNNIRWWLSVVIQCIFIPAVPIFFILSGTNLLNYRNRYSTKYFFKKRFIRTFIPFIMWSLVWYLYHYFSSIRPLVERSLLNGILTDKIQPIFWFFYSIFGFYLITPILSRLMIKTNKATIKYFIIANILLSGVFGYYYRVIDKPVPTILTSIPLLTTSAIVYYLIGWYLNEFGLSQRQNRILYFSGFFALLLMIGLTFNISIIQGRTARDVYTIFGLPAMLYSIAVYQFVKNKLINWRPIGRAAFITREFASLSLGIYCIHEFFVYFSEDVLNLYVSSYYHMLVLPFIVYILSAAVVFIVKRIPIIRNLFSVS